MIQTIHVDNIYVQYDDQLMPKDVFDCFSSGFWQQQQKIIGSAQGRGTTWFVQLDRVQAALRHYRRGGLFAKIVSDHYFFINWGKTRSIAEFNLLEVLNQSGVNVPRPIAAKVQKKGFFYQADLLSEKIPEAADLLDILQQRSLTIQEYQAIGLQIKKMHQAQVNHTDLNIHNILLDKTGKVWLIDFDKCYQQSSKNWQAANLERLLRSFNKELRKRAIKWQASDWQYLIAGYMA
jgi:3-deoxy-D-manno-octulosonic acid kinase